MALASASPLAQVWTDDECGIRETSRSFSGLGKADDALKVLCTSKYAAAAPSCAGAVAKE